MDDTTSAIIEILFGLLALGAMMIPVLGFFVFVGFQNSKRKRIREKILAANPGIGEHFPVRYASRERFDAFLKIFPWDSAGIIFRAPQGIVFLGEQMSGNPIVLQFSPESVQWIGRAPWPNGAVSWFSAAVPGTTHYFTSETGFFIVGSKSGTNQIYERLSGVQQLPR